jgi:hypothetical protein
MDIGRSAFMFPEKRPFSGKERYINQEGIAINPYKRTDFSKALQILAPFRYLARDFFNLRSRY